MSVWYPPQRVLGGSSDVTGERRSELQQLGHWFVKCRRQDGDGCRREEAGIETRLLIGKLGLNTYRVGLRVFYFLSQRRQPRHHHGCAAARRAAVAKLARPVFPPAHRLAAPQQRARVFRPRRQLRRAR